MRGALQKDKYKKRSCRKHQEKDGTLSRFIFAFSLHADAL